MSFVLCSLCITLPCFLSMLHGSQYWIVYTFLKEAPFISNANNTKVSSPSKLVGGKCRNRRWLRYWAQRRCYQVLAKAILWGPAQASVEASSHSFLWVTQGEQWPLCLSYSVSSSPCDVCCLALENQVHQSIRLFHIMYFDLPLLPVPLHPPFALATFPSKLKKKKSFKRK